MKRSARIKKEDGKERSPLKWIGGVAAVVSLLLGLNQVTGVVQKFRIHYKEFSESMQAGEQQLGRSDYPAAFASFKHAVELDPIDHDAQTREAQAAMLWLENAHAGTRTFTETANQLLPVLDNALTRAKGPDAADLLAHIGWANFLKYRDGQREGVTVDENYKKALDIDAGNAYAHAMWGHWILGQRGKLDDANSHFRAALAANRVRPYVRELQISALMNRGQDTAAETELLKVANEMRKGGEPMEEVRERPYILWASFTTKLRDRDELVKSLSVLSPADMEATYDWLAGGDQSESGRWNREFVIANLRELAGNLPEALAQYTSLQKELRGSDSVLPPYVDQAVKRLSAHK